MKKIAFIFVILLASNICQTQAQNIKQIGKQVAVSTLLSLAQQNPQLSKFVAIVQAAGLTNLLTGSNENPVTLLAPNNAALEAMSGELATLMKPENKNKLVDLVKNHIISGNVLAANLKTTESTLSNELNVVTKNGKTTVEGANIVQKDLKASNGTVHIIDKVIMPKY
jgi:uncharacterized surface protein with fasciclin (FAS1) repeats